jgi:superfamily II DNA/RNA helicase
MRFAELLTPSPEFYGIVFCRTRNETDQVADKLIDNGYDAEAIHGDVTQSQRESILKKFKLRKLNILVATDVAARGIDVNDLTHVVNFNLPQDPEAYVHRIGRTGRAGKHGTAITIVSSREVRDLLYIQKIAKSQIRKEEVPSIADVLETKKMKLKTEISELMEKGGNEAYLNVARELMEDGKEAEQVLAALLAYSFKDSLKENSYREISEGKASAAFGGSKTDARLFIAKGHMDNMNAARIADFVAQEANVRANDLHDIRVFDKFSFITAPNEVAEQVLAILGRSRNGKKPLVTRAKEKELGSGSGSRGGGNSGSGGSWKNKGGSESGGRSRSESSFGDRKPFGERKKFEDRGEKKSFGENRGFEDKKQFSPRTEFKKDYVKKESTGSKDSSETKPLRKRENKMTDYLETKQPSEKPSKKKADTSDVAEFMKKFEDDLSW